MEKIAIARVGFVTAKPVCGIRFNEQVDDISKQLNGWQKQWQVN
jgi:hypothetical protein